jgi:hypothetical protein
MRGRLLAVWLGLAGVGVFALTDPLRAHAQEAEAELASLREVIRAARFSDAVASAQALLERADLSALDRNTALELLAVAQLANRETAAAERTLQLLYARDPNHRLSDPDASPPVLSAFARARESTPTPVTVRLEHEQPTLRRREPPELVVRVIEGADAVAEVRLVYRMGDEAPLRVEMTQRADGSYLARIPVVGDASRATDVAYHVTALAPSLASLAEVGSAAEPIQLRIPADATPSSVATRAPRAGVERAPAGLPTAPSEPSRSIVEEWWFWTVIGVVVAAGVTTGAVLGTASSGPEQGSLGTVRLMSVELP